MMMMITSSIIKLSLGMFLWVRLRATCAWIIMRLSRNKVYKSGGTNLGFKTIETEQGELLVALVGTTERKVPIVHCQARWLDHRTVPNTGE